MSSSFGAGIFGAGFFGNAGLGSYPFPVPELTPAKFDDRYGPYSTGLIRTTGTMLTGDWMPTVGFPFHKDTGAWDRPDNGRDLFFDDPR